MKIKQILATLLLILFFGIMNAQTVNVKKLPASVDEFLKLRNEIATSPEGGATMFLIAMKIYVNNPELGKKSFVIAADRGALYEGDTYKGFSLRKSDLQLIELQLKKNNKIPDSYIKGSSPDNGYKADEPFEYEFKSNPYSGDPEKGVYKIFVYCSGADSARPITLKKNSKGLWKASSWSSVLVGIKKEPIDDDL